MPDFIDTKKNKILVNTSIHRKANLSKKLFLDRIANFEGLRTQQNYISLYVRTEEDDHELTDLWRLVNEGDFRLRIFPDTAIFVVSLEHNFYKWFKKYDVELIRKQICNWISATCLMNPDSKDDLLNSLYEPYANEIEHIIEHFYSPDFDEKYSYYRFDPKENNPQEQRDLILERNSEYKSAALKYFNCPPPKELPNPFEESHSITFYHSLESALPKIQVRAAYIRDDDWLAIVERDLTKLEEYYHIDTGKSHVTFEDLQRMLSEGEIDNMMRAESQKEPWEIWKNKFC